MANTVSTRIDFSVCQVSRLGTWPGLLFQCASVETSRLRWRTFLAGLFGAGFDQENQIELWVVRRRHQRRAIDFHIKRACGNRGASVDAAIDDTMKGHLGPRPHDEFV